MACKILDNLEEMKVVNVPRVSFRSFVNIADKNSINGNLMQILCYLLGPKQKTHEDEIWIDTIVIPMQLCSESMVEDNGIDKQNTITYLRESSVTKHKELYAWVHSRPVGPNECEFTSTDMHTQFILEKYVSKDIIGIVIQIRKYDYVWKSKKLNIFGKQILEFCGKNFDTPFDDHKSCACDCLFESCKSSIKVWDEIPFGKSKVLMANFMEKREPGKSNWSIANEPSASESEEENNTDEVLCENCEKSLTQLSILKHISHNKECKAFYGPRNEIMKKRKNRNKVRKHRKKNWNRARIETAKGDAQTQI